MDKSNVAITASRALATALGFLAGSAMSAQDALFVAPNGNVGIGTTNPTGQVHIYGVASTDVFAGMGPDVAAGPAFNYGYSGATFGRSSGFFNVRPDLTLDPNGTRPAVYFMTQNIARIVLDRDGNIGFGTNVAAFNPANPLVHQPTNARLQGGIWTDGSSRAIKENIHPLSTEDALAALIELDPVRFRYKSEPAEEALGFIAEDVPELVATNDRTGLSPMDIVAVLTQVVKEQEKRLDFLAAQLATLSCAQPSERSATALPGVRSVDHE